MTGATPSLAIEVYKRPKASGLTADDGNHERKSEHSCANERFGRAADTDPYGERILQRARVDCLAGKGRAVFSGPLHLRDRKSTRLNSSHVAISYAVFCLKKKNMTYIMTSYTVRPP